MATAVPIRVCQDFVQGDSFIIKVSHNPVIDLTGATFELTLKLTETSIPVLSEVYAVPITEPEATNATNGIVNIPIPSASTALVAPGKYLASLKRTLAAGDLKTLVRTGKGGAQKVTCYKNLKSA